MATRQYKGARYVPIFDGDWDNTKDYDPLIIVLYQGNSYTSRTFVPHGTAITNQTYWALTGNYNAQVEAYRQEVENYKQLMDNMKTSIVNVIDFGADNTGVTNSQSEFIDAIDACNAGDTLYIPEGVYTLTDTIVIDKNININCEGEIQITHVKPVFHLDGISHVNIFINKIAKDTYGNYNYTANSINNSIAVLLDACFDVNLKVRNIVNTLVGVMLYASDGEGCYYNNISVDYLDGCCYCFDLISNEDGWINANTIHNAIWQCHSWYIPSSEPLTEAPGCMVRNHGYKDGDTPYYNNYNIFENLMCEFASEIAYHPILVDLEYARGFYITFTRVELPGQDISEVGHTSVVNVSNSISCFVDVQGHFDTFQYNIANGCGSIVSYSEFVSSLTGTNLYNHLKQRLEYRNTKLVAFDGDTSNFLIGADAPLQGFATIWSSNVVVINLMLAGRIVTIRLASDGTMTKYTTYTKDDVTNNIYATTVFGSQSISNKICSAMIPLNGANKRTITIIEATAPNIASLTVSNIVINRYADGFNIEYPYDASLAGAYVDIKYSIS